MTIKQKESAVSGLAVTIWRDSSWSKRSTVRSNDLRKGKSKPLSSEAIYFNLKQYLSNLNNLIVKLNYVS